MPLDRARIEAVLTVVLDAVPDAAVRLVGTASSVLRGIDIPAGDIDIVFSGRAAVDEWTYALAADHIIETGPRWLPDTSQYFARLVVDGVNLELSTVEIATECETMECFGAGPWRHFNLVRCGPREVPAVETELRLLTEFDRGRTDHYRATAAFLHRTGCDLELIRTGLQDRSAGKATIDAVIADIADGV